MYKEFAEFIVNMRTAAGLSTHELAHHMCMSVTTLEACERGEKIPRNPAKFEHHLRNIVKQEIRKQRCYAEIRYTAV